MAKVLKAIPTTYNGIEFRSKLEAKYARAFDLLGIVWEYEGHGFQFDDGTFYCPDFYMPEIDTYFEVKGSMDESSEHKLLMLAREHEFVVVGDSAGNMRRVDAETRKDDLPDKPGYSTATLSICHKCKHLFFRSVELGWGCPCGFYDGDGGFSDIEGIDNEESNLFVFAGWGGARKEL